MNSVCWLPRSFMPSKCSRRRRPSRSLNVESLRRMYLNNLRPSFGLTSQVRPQVNITFRINKQHYVKRKVKELSPVLPSEVGRERW
ncbi:MAG: hypothetical protein ACTS44_01365 [Candidatus Hodgkinia cicadicola]